MRFVLDLPTTFFEKVRAPVSCLLHHSARSCARVGLLAGLMAGALLPGLARAEDQTAPGAAVTATADEELLLAATELSSGNVLRFVGLSTFGVDDAANVDDLGPPRPAESSEPASELVPAADRAKASLDFEDADGAGHELWVVSTRNLPGNICSCPTPEFSPGVERFTCGHGWSRSSMEELLATDVPSRTTAILVMATTTAANEAEARGREFFRELVTGCCNTAPTRLIVWSWPSDKVICSYRKDAQLKACRTNVEGYYLARFVDQLSADTPVTIGGYSYGARVVTGGLHLLGGGVLEGRQLAERAHPNRQSTCALLMGAAMANTWLLPGMRHDRAVSQVDRMMILFNPKDFVLHFYPRLWGGRGPEALGATGLAANRLGPEQIKIRQVNIQPQMHRRHGWDYFADSPAIMSLVRRELLSHRS